MEPSCPIQTKNHFEHDEKIRALQMEIEVFKFATERTPRLLAMRIIELQKLIDTNVATKERSTLLREVNRLRQENADLIKQAHEVKQILEEATR